MSTARWNECRASVNFPAVPEQSADEAMRAGQVDLKGRVLGILCRQPLEYSSGLFRPLECLCRFPLLVTQAAQAVIGKIKSRLVGNRVGKSPVELLEALSGLVATLERRLKLTGLPDRIQQRSLSSRARR